MKLFGELFDGGNRFWISTHSEGITNSKSKECGSFHLRKVVPKMACYKANTEVCLISWFALVSKHKFDNFFTVLGRLICNIHFLTFRFYVKPYLAIIVDIKLQFWSF